MTYREYLKTVRELADGVRDDQFEDENDARQWRESIKDWADGEVAKLPSGGAPKIAKRPDAPPPRKVERSKLETPEEKVERIEKLSGKE
ncbi:MAG: hypothetical protein KF764_34490 [Labilithrix sp.]|nr:hypothetical protein [Labilithrix sp.]